MVALIELRNVREEEEFQPHCSPTRLAWVLLIAQGRVTVFLGLSPIFCPGMPFAVSAFQL